MAYQLQPSRPHFFQPLLPGSATSLSIPVAFYDEYLRTFGSKKRVELRSRRRRRGWKVEMVGRRIVNGWREFFDDHELKVGYFLVFSYVGDLGFDVFVFDESECEIEFQQMDDDLDVILVEEENYGVESEENVAKVSGWLAEEQNGKRTRVPTDVESAESFVGTMWPAYLKCLRFPIKFCAANKLNDLCTEIIIKDDKGKDWHVNLRGCKSDKTLFTKNGWRSFVKGNDIRQGDKFELRIVSKGTTPVLSYKRICMEDQDEVLICAKRQKVVEVPKLDTLSSRINCAFLEMDKDESKENDEELVDFDRMKRRNNEQKREEVHYTKKTSSSSVEHVTYFVRTSTQTSLDQSRFFLGKRFARANKLATKCGKIILQNSDGESWVATMKHESKNRTRVYITTGWTEFALANGLEAGRVFRMEIGETETKKITLKLTNKLAPEDFIKCQETKKNQQTSTS